MTGAGSERVAFRLSFRSESNVKMTYTYNPQHLVFCIDYFRGELFKAQYLFASLTLSASIGSSTLENIVVKSLSTLNLQPTSTDLNDGQFNEDIIDIQRCHLPPFHSRNASTGRSFFFLSEISVIWKNIFIC